MITLFAAALVAHKTSAPIQTNPMVKFGKYQAELRIPDGGLFAQEESDVEFRVVDTTQKDPVEPGFKGVGAIDATATMTMPSMVGMPMVKPSFHREGVPGDYGLALYFGHGGEYQIDLDLMIPNDTAKHIAFRVEVKDERPAHLKLIQPYRLDLMESPNPVMAGRATQLKLKVIDTKTGRTQTEFDTAHEKQFHLLIASKDLNWFRHEHPVMASDGTWSISQVFPAGGEYWIYGDVAPSGKGSRILISKIKVAGPKPIWNTKLTLSSSGVDKGLKGVFGSESPLLVGRSTRVRIKLFDMKTKAPTVIRDPYLGAVGHLMIFSQDGLSVVHSHPVEDRFSDAQAKAGVVRFTARFPKPGLYKAYAQFNWHGSVKTLPFTILVKK
jgi:hypothetical protein